MSRRVSGIVGVFVCASVLIVGATGSVAGTVKRAGTSLTAFADTDREVVFGEVGSNKPKCVRLRKIIAFDSEGDKIGQDRPNKRGRYRIDASDASATPVGGTVIAKRKVFGNERGMPNLICKQKERTIKDRTPGGDDGILPPLPLP